jgi:hypothetical protein
MPQDAFFPYAPPISLIVRFLRMFNRFFWQQLLHFSHNTALEWWSDETVEEEGTIYQEHETKDLKPLEGFPTKEQRYDPNEQCPAGING